jgi:predicted O-linked N-acetylglucosamine transferase (SPINDLY family)
VNAESPFDQAFQAACQVHDAGRPEEAETLYRQLLDSHPGEGEITYRLAMALAQQGKAHEAEQQLNDLLVRHPKRPEAHFQRGNLLAAMGRFADAAESFSAALELAPDLIESRVNLGNVLQILKRSEQAVQQFDAVIARQPELAPVWFNRGNALSDLSRHEDAVASFDRALELDPLLAQALNNKGAALERLNRHGEAINCYRSALRVRPDHGPTCRNLGAALFEARQYDEAVAAYQRAFDLDPEQDYLFGALLGAKASLCAWESHGADTASAVAAVRAGKRAIHPFIFLGLWDRPEDHQTCARIWSQHHYPPAAEPLWQGERYSHDRIRVAYVSADFHDHPMAYLMSGLFECHDRSKFETMAISFGPPSDGPQRKRFESAFERFIDVRSRSDIEIARLLRDLEVDIAIDRKGLTRGARPNIFAMRPAPVQVSYVAYTGTMAAPYIDYLIADETVIPTETRQYYSEQIVDLPGCYLPNDGSRPIAPSQINRSEAGLPEDGFVYCAFGNSWKITPDMFGIWMRLLQAVNGSVLWLIEHSPATTRKLRSEAEARGISADRLVFARHIANAEHLARHKLADLSLDTLPYGAHTTASDSLWAGVPIITCPGAAFAGRVTTSMLLSLGLPELIAPSLGEYEALALKLAEDPEERTRLRDRLAAQLKIRPLFDTALYCRHLETAYETMWRRSQAGEAPNGFAVPDFSGTSE